MLRLLNTPTPSTPRPRSIPRPRTPYTFTATIAMNRHAGVATAPTCPTELVILGSGVSTAVPKISCVIRQEAGVSCAVCSDALNNPQSPNRRCNVAALVRSAGRTVLIDCGKTTREAAMRHFPKLGVTNVDAIVLTHGHADAMLGLDDARDIQLPPVKSIVDGKELWIHEHPTPVFLNEETMDVCRRVFPYLMSEEDKPALPENAKKDIERRVAAIEWNAYGEDRYFVPFRPVPDAEIEFTPFPMLHGGDYICMGFLIKVREAPQSKESVIAFLSDLHKLPDESMNFLEALPAIDLLVVDVLTHDSRNKSHYSLSDAKNLVRKLRPCKAVAVGMTCSLGMHDQVNEGLVKMREEGLDFQLSYDGQRFPCP